MKYIFAEVVDSLEFVSLCISFSSVLVFVVYILNIYNIKTCIIFK